MNKGKPITLSVALEDFGEVMSEQKHTREVQSFWAPL
jgi:hypothetical protein